MINSVWAWLLLGITAGASVASAVISLLVLRMYLDGTRPGRHSTPEPARPVEVKPSRREVLVPAPMWEGVTLRQWVIHHNRLRDGLWAEVVEEFYKRAEGVPAVASFFHRADMRSLKQHFTAALMLVTDIGLTRQTLEHLGQRHAAVTNRENQPITPEIYRAVVATLVAVLEEKGVPIGAINELGKTLAPLEAVIVPQAEARR